MLRLQTAFTLFTIGIFLTPPAAVRAAVNYSEERDENGMVETTVIRMTVTPASEPVPTFKYRLQPLEIDLVPGNAVPFYYRALLDLPGRRSALGSKFNIEEQLDSWWTTGDVPIDKLPLDKVRDAVEAAFGGVLGEQLRLAVSQRDCDWDIGLDELRGPDLVSIPLQEFNDSRWFSRFLALRTRLAIAEHRYGDAIESMRMNYRVAQDFASAPFLVSGLIGIAEASITNGTLLDLVAAPDSPNMYWALAELPQPLVNLRPAARFEMEFGMRMFPFIQDAETADRSPQEWNRLYTKAVQDLSTMGGGSDIFSLAHGDVGAGVVATAVALAGYSHAKAALVASGLDRDRARQMSVGQVMAIYSGRIYQRYANDMERTWYVPFSQMRKYNAEVESRLAKAAPLQGNADREVLPIVSLLLPAMQAARAAQVRLERDTAALQVIEALRIYAAANDGRLPENLDAVTQVPIPVNPATGRPFVYRLDGKTAILSLPESDGTPGYDRRYEIQTAELQN